MKIYLQAQTREKTCLSAVIGTLLLQKVKSVSSGRKYAFVCAALCTNRLISHIDWAIRPFCEFVQNVTTLNIFVSYFHPSIAIFVEGCRGSATDT